MKKYAFFVMLVLTGTISTGCIYSWTDSKPLSHSLDDIWNTTYGVLARRYDIIRASREERTMETDWKLHLSIMYLQGYRCKVYIKIEDYLPKKEEVPETDVVESSAPKAIPPQYILKIQVRKEQNRNADNPASGSEAEWYPAGTDLEEEQNLLAFIEARLTFKRSTDELAR